jgi:Putative Ig domain
MMRMARNRFNFFVSLFVLLLSGLIAGCESVEESVTPPAGLSYRDASAAYVTGTEIVPNTPSSSGGPITHYSVAPVLPVGLSLNPQTGVISGVPMQTSAPAIYTVTGSNAAGSATARVQIEVRASAIAPENLQYRDNPVSYAVGTEIPPNMPSSSGGEITRHSVSPALPAGLQWDMKTGVISGIPMSVSAPTAYTVTGSNSAGSVQVELHIETRAQAVPPAGLSYSDSEPVYAVAQPIVPNEPRAVGGEITGYSVSPQLPAGLSMDAQTGVIGGTPVGMHERAVYTVTGSNSAGSVAAQVAITVTPLGKWLPARSMNAARSEHTASLLSNGRRRGKRQQEVDRIV